MELPQTTVGLIKKLFYGVLNGKLVLMPLWLQKQFLVLSISVFIFILRL